MTSEEGSLEHVPARARIILGGAIFGVGLLSPLAIPLIAASQLSIAWRVALSGMLLLGLPQLLLMVAIGVIGKDGFGYLKQLLFRVLRRQAPPPGRVGSARYRLGLLMFSLPLLLGFLGPYVGHLIPGYASHPVAFAVLGDVLILASLFVLGGDFWDKLRALFVHDARAMFPVGESA